MVSEIKSPNTAAKTPKVIVITGFGLNCEKETTYAFERAGARVDRVHLNDILSGDVSLQAYQILALIGGFSFGDHIAAGRVFAIKLKYRLNEEIERFIAEGNLIIGICNGFQVMVKLGILPGMNGDYKSRSISLFTNDSGTFYDGWIHLKVNPESPCIFTRGIKQLYLPVRHGEGKFVTQTPELMSHLRRNAQIVMRYIDPETGEPTQKYPENPNGSEESVAAICDQTGRIFGMMPHPEAFLDPLNHPHWTREKILKPLPQDGEGLQIFRNAVNFARDNLL